MSTLILAAWAAVGLFPSPGHFDPLPTALAASSRVDIPLKVPKGWKSEKQDGSTVLTPADVPDDKVFVVMATPIEGKAGSLDEVLDAGKKLIGEIGEFKALAEPQQSTSGGNWDYKVLIGGVQKGGGSFLAQVVALKKGDEGGVLLVISDSVETMEKYAEPLAEMLRDLGGKREVVAPAAAASKPGIVDLAYNVPEGWKETKSDGIPILVKEFKDNSNPFYHGADHKMTLLVMPTVDLKGSSLRAVYKENWAAHVSGNFTTSIMPLPLMRRLNSGYACAFDLDGRAKKNPNDDPISAGIYVISHGGKAVPIVAFFSGNYVNLEKDLDMFLQTARIPGASEARTPLFSAADMVGDWEKSSYSAASYVSAGGAYAGDASIATGENMTLKSDGTYKYSFKGVGQGRAILKDNAGTWKVEEDLLMLSKEGSYSLFGYGGDPKVGRFLVISLGTVRSTLPLSDPRGAFLSTWFKSK